MGLDSDIAIRDMFYLLFGLFSLLGVLYAIGSGRRRDSDAAQVRSNDDRERIVRIDENTKELRSDVADIKAEIRQTKNNLSEHERRIIQLETDGKVQWQRIDELAEVVGIAPRKRDENE